jgi:hypothetical protein
MTAVWPYNSIMPRFWGGPADGEIRAACDKPITKQQLVMDGIVSTFSDKKPVQFHVRCTEDVACHARLRV